MSEKGILRPRILSREFLFVGVLFFFIVIFILLLGRALNAELNHDEHQFVASGKLLADQFSFPYIDYPFHHMPNLALIYGLLFKLTNFSLLGARVLSVTWATLSVVILFYIAFEHFNSQGSLIQSLLAIACVILLITNPLFGSVSGKAWNHDLPTLLILLSFALLCRYDSQDISIRKVFLSGILLGLAIGTRLSYATMIIPYLGAFLFFPSQRSRTVKYLYIMAFSIGVSLGLLPSIVLFIANPKFFALHQNCPNPFNPTTTINYSVAKHSYIRLMVYNTMGQVVAVLVDGFQAQGSYNVMWNAEGQPSGFYIYQLEANGFTASKKMFLQK